MKLDSLTRCILCAGVQSDGSVHHYYDEGSIVFSDVWIRVLGYRAVVKIRNKFYYIHLHANNPTGKPRSIMKFDDVDAAIMAAVLDATSQMV